MEAGHRHFRVERSNRSASPARPTTSCTSPGITARTCSTRAIAADGKVGATTPVVSGWSGILDAALTPVPGGIRAFWGGIRTTESHRAQPRAELRALDGRRDIVGAADRLGRAGGRAGLRQRRGRRDAAGRHDAADVVRHARDVGPRRPRPGHAERRLPGGARQLRQLPGDRRRRGRPGDARMVLERGRARRRARPGGRRRRRARRARDDDAGHAGDDRQRHRDAHADRGAREERGLLRRVSGGLSVAPRGPDVEGRRVQVHPRRPRAKAARRSRSRRTPRAGCGSRGRRGRSATSGSWPRARTPRRRDSASRSTRGSSRARTRSTPSTPARPTSALDVLALFGTGNESGGATYVTRVRPGLTLTARALRRPGDVHRHRRRRPGQGRDA